MREECRGDGIVLAYEFLLIHGLNSTVLDDHASLNDRCVDIAGMTKDEGGQRVVECPGISQPTHRDAEEVGTLARFEAPDIRTTENVRPAGRREMQCLTRCHQGLSVGAGQILPAIIGNEVQLTMLNLASSLPHLKAGRIKPLATTWPTRRAEFPDIQTMAEAGYPGIGTNAWNGLFGPAKLPPALLAYLHASALKVLESPDMKEALGKQLISVVTSKSPAEYAKFVNEDIAKWAAVIRDNNISLD